VPFPLGEYAVAGRQVRIVATDRTDGDIHPERVLSEQLVIRQRRATGRRWVMVDEVHGTDVVEVNNVDAEAEIAGVGDVVVTTSADLDIAVWTADCAPLFLLVDDGTTVGAHAGWKGLAEGVVDIAVKTARRDSGRVAVAVLGPVIGPCCYEFGTADLALVASGVHARPAAITGKTAEGGTALDVPAAVRSALDHHGIVLDLVGPCTGCDERWFSHRVRADVGRHATIASIGQVQR
jgi:copper oxidase (laccase) domain-containing protein